MSISSRQMTRALSISALSVTLLCGCFGKPTGPQPVPVSGKITLDGKPLMGARVTFDSDHRPAVGITSTEGTYKLSLGALPGDYRVAIGDPPGAGGMTQAMAPAPAGEKAPPVPVELPAKFSDPKQTALKFTVTKDGPNIANFDLTTK